MKDIINQAKTFEELLALKYGASGSTQRNEFEMKAKALYICELLKEERKKAHLSQGELAEKIAMKKEFISRIENGKADIQLSTFLKILEGLGLKMVLTAE